MQALEHADQLSRSFDAGNYANAYHSTDLDIAWERVDDGTLHRGAFVIAFFSSYETHEVPGEYVDELLGAHVEFGDALKAIGIAVDDRGEVR